MPMEKYRFLDGDGKIKFVAFGKSMEEAFENSAYVLIDVLCKEKVKDALVTKIKISGKDREKLLCNFLEQILMLISSNNFLLNRINRISKTALNKEGEYEFVADISGDDAREYTLKKSIKKVVYEEMFVKDPDSIDKKRFSILKTGSFSAHEKDRWIAQVVLEI